MSTRKVHYLAIIGDLVGSRSLEPSERRKVQERFERSLTQINERYRDEIEALFLITLGDEAQGLLHRFDHLYEILRQIMIELYPYEIVFGVGHGELTTDIGEYAVGADGPAFHHAREALDRAKHDRREYGKSVLREIRFQSRDELSDRVINALFLAQSVMRSGWTKKQARILHLLENSVAPKDIAKKLEIPLPNVSRTIDSTGFREYEEIKEGLQAALIGSSSKSELSR